MPESSTNTAPIKSPVKANKMGVVVKSPKNSTGINLPVVTTTSPKPIINEPDFNEADLPVIQGSFTISKTEADITEKKPDITETKAKPEKSTTVSPRKTTFKETSVTSAPYKIPGNKGKVTKVESTTPVSTTLKTTVSTTRSTSVTTPITTEEGITENQFKGKSSSHLI